MSAAELVPGSRPPKGKSGRRYEAKIQSATATPNELEKSGD